MNKVIKKKIAVWLVLIIWGINQSFNMISQANTVEEVLARENFALGEMTSGLKYPESLEASITAKNKAVQDALKIEKLCYLEIEVW